VGAGGHVVVVVVVAHAHFNKALLSGVQAAVGLAGIHR